MASRKKPGILRRPLAALARATALWRERRFDQVPVNPVSVCFLTLEQTVERYLLDMGAWLKMRELTDQWVEVRYERVAADPPREARRTLELLHAPRNEAILDYRTPANAKPVRSPSYEEVARPLFTSSIGRWQNYQRQLAPALGALAPLVTAMGYEG